MRRPARAPAISPTASTWPNTMWPPSSSPMRSERSRLTVSPTAQAPAVVTSRVAAEASTVNQSVALVDRGEADARGGDRAAERDLGERQPGPDGHAPAAAVGDLEHPADIGDDPGEHDAPSVRVHDIRLHARHAPASGCASAPGVRHSASASAPSAPTAGRPSPPISSGAWNQASRSTRRGAQQRCGERAAALDQHPGDPARRERGQTRLPGRVTAGSAPARSAPRRRSARARRAASRSALGARDDPGRHRARRCARGGCSGQGADGRPGRCAPASARSRPGRRQVSSGSSASAVPLPIMIASWVARSMMAALRAPPRR